MMDGGEGGFQMLEIYVKQKERNQFDAVSRDQDTSDMLILYIFSPS